MKIAKIIVAVALVTAILTACGDDVDITIHKITSDYVPEASDIIIVGKDESIPITSQDTSSKDTTSGTTSKAPENLPYSAKVKAQIAAKYFFPRYTGYNYYYEGIATIGGYECYVIEVFSTTNEFLATYAVGVDYDYVSFAYDTTNEQYRIMTITGEEVSLGNYANTLVSHGTYTNQPAGYTFTYDGEPTIRTENNTTIFSTPLWVMAIEGEVPTATLDFSSISVRRAQEDTVMRQMIEGLGLVFDWAQDSSIVSVRGMSLVQRNFFATYGDTEVEYGTVYYGYATNGMFYKITIFALGEGNSVGNILSGIEFTTRVVGGTVRDQRTSARQPSWPNSSAGSDVSETTSKVDRPFGW